MARRDLKIIEQEFSMSHPAVAFRGPRAAQDPESQFVQAGAPR